MDYNDFPSIELVNDYLDEVAHELPEDFFVELNNGILLLEEAKFHPMSVPGRELYILGEYANEITGNCIRIYYGSFRNLFYGYGEHYIKDKLRETLLHEFRHHIEKRAGVNDLVYEDESALEEYRRKLENG